MEEQKRVRKLTSALNIYQKYTDNTLNIDDIQRVDMHFRMKTGADMVIEETGLHTKNPFKLKIEEILNWSKEQSDNVQNILENYNEYFNSVKKRFETEIVATYKPYLATDGYSTPPEFADENDAIKHLQERIKYLRQHEDSFDAQTELQHRVKNVFDYLYNLNGKNLENPLIKTYLDDFTYTNQCTVLQSVKEEEPKPDQPDGTPTPHNEYAHKQRLYSIGEIIEMTADPMINLRDKLSRPLVLPHNAGRRLTGDELYSYWNGLQIFDIDLKFSDLYYKNPSLTAENHRDIVFNKLKHYPWLLGVTLSSSGRALHVYTKVSRMHHLFDDIEINSEISKYWYRMSYIQKHAAIAYILYHECGITDIYENKKVFDTALSKPSQGIAINHDPNAKWSSGFMDLYPAIFYHVPPVKGIELSDWLITPKILSHYANWFYDFAGLDETNDSVQIRENKLNIIVDSDIELEGVSQIDMDAMSNGDRYSTRWRICNTIMAAFGDNDKAKALCHHILQSVKTGKVKEVNSFIRSAIINRKEADMSTIKTLKKLGVKIGIDEETQEIISDEALEKVKYTLENSDYAFYSNNPDHNVLLGNGEYIGMKMPQVLNSLKDFQVNVIDSPPNTGKTEFFKELAKTKTVCLVLPYTSIIESKIVNDDSINELFDLYYGDRSVSEIKKGRSVVMTIDKFSLLSKAKYSLFDIIGIDESHLLFTSVYRLPVVSQTIENIRNYLIEDNRIHQKAVDTITSVQNLMNFLDVSPVQQMRQTTKVILMTGTITGELDYFKYYGILNYIKIHKKHPYKKELSINICKTPDTRDIALIKSIANKIRSGGKVIHPTNKGDAYIKQIVRGVEYDLNRSVTFDYYKRANADEDFMYNINANTTVEDIELLFCSDYLSVGIDIKDEGSFDVVFSNDFTSESIEQFNNRLRSTNIHCKLFFDVTDSLGQIKPNIINTNNIEYKSNDEFQRMIEDERNIAILRKTINEKQQYYAVLGEMFSKYFIEDFGGNIRYIKSAFEIEQFEKQYSIIARSLLYIKTALVNRHQYEYRVNAIPEYSDEQIEKYEIMMKDAKEEHDIMKTESFIRLVDFLGRPDIYEISQKVNIVFSKDNDDLLGEDTDLHFGFDENYLGGSYIITWNKKHKYSMEDAKRYVRKMRKIYSNLTSVAIIGKNLKENGVLRKIEIERYMNLMNLMYDDKKNALSPHTRDLIKQAYSYVDPEEDVSKMEYDDYIDMKINIRKTIEESFEEITKQKIQSQRRMENVDQQLNNFIDTVFIKTVGKKNVKIKFRKVLPFDSETIKVSLERDKIYRSILLNDQTEIDPMETNVLSEYHVEEQLNEFL